MCVMSDTSKGINSDVAIFSCNAGDRSSLIEVRTKKLTIPSKAHVCASWSTVAMVAAGNVSGGATPTGQGPFML